MSLSENGLKGSSSLSESLLLLLLLLLAFRFLEKLSVLLSSEMFVEGNRTLKVPPAEGDEELLEGVGARAGARVGADDEDSSSEEDGSVDSKSPF